MKEKIKRFLRPDSRRILVFLTIIAIIVTVLILGPSLFPVGSSSGVLVIPQILLGVFLAVVTVPFTLVASVFRAFGVDTFYTTGIVAEASVAIGIVLTLFWGYVISCLVTFVYDAREGAGCAHMKMRPRPKKA